jgi:hypothetical protein
MMVYRAAIWGTALLAAIGLTAPAHAVGEAAQAFRGTCSSGALTSHPLNYGTISESDGIQVVANGMSGKDYLEAMKRARASHLTLGADGLLWATQPISCDSVIVWPKANSNAKGETLISFTNGDPNKPVLGFTGVPVDGDGPLFFPDGVYLGDGKPPIEIDSHGNGQTCRFYFTDHGAFTQGWENRLTTIECGVRVKRADGHLVSVDVKFHRAELPELK